MATSRKFKQLKLGSAKADSLPPSVPLIVPDDCEYDPRTKQLRRREGVTRSKLEVVEDAVALLQDINKPVAVLSICGPYRTGKSYILSRMLGSSDAFDLGHTMDAKTCGIWTGTTALECDEFVLILLDTEGIDAVSAKMTDDASILVMTILLSSYLVYNSLNVPQKSDLEKMSCFTKLSNGIVVREGQKNTTSSFPPHFPNFLWLLRDVHLLPVDDHGKEISPTKYLTDRILRKSDDFDESSDDRVKRAIMAFFPTVECKTLPHPSADPEVMRAITTNQHKLNPAFNQGVADLVEYLFAKVQVKRGFQKCSKVDGPMLVELMKHYVQAVNDPKAIPQLDNAWEAVITLRCEAVLSKLTKEYESDLEARMKEASNGLPLEDDSSDAAEQDSTLMGIHRKVLSSKVRRMMDELSHFVSGTGTENGQTSEKLMAELEARIVQYNSETIKDAKGMHHERRVVTGGILHKHVRQNHDKSQEYCHAKFEELYKPISQKVASPSEDYTFQDLVKDLAHLHEGYDKVARGPAKWDVFSSRMKEVEKDKMLFKQLKGYQADLLSKVQEAAQADAERRQTQAKLDEVRQQAQEEEKHQRETMKLMQQQHEQEKAEIKRIEDERRLYEERKIQELINANMEQMAMSAAENNKALTEKFADMLRTMQAAQEQRTTEMTKMLTAVINKPAPAPPPRDEGCSIL